MESLGGFSEETKQQRASRKGKLKRNDPLFMARVQGYVHVWAKLRGRSKKRGAEGLWNRNFGRGLPESGCLFSTRKKALKNGKRVKGRQE